MADDGSSRLHGGACPARATGSGPNAAGHAVASERLDIVLERPTIAHA